ncbi:GM23373 [Drosophila sechellia]|uniref:GM23373 n=1 Tax=Drosophila sechellia TaxID=7238 RepID=B4IFG6_DROSE|nr:GM23373 [Drosophila sechellia]
MAKWLHCSSGSNCGGAHSSWKLHASTWEKSPTGISSRRTAFPTAHSPKEFRFCLVRTDKEPSEISSWKGTDG